MKFSPVEKIEILRNIRFAIRMKMGIQKDVRISDVFRICEGKGNVIEPDDKKVSFIGFLNEFDDVYGKGCIYIHLFNNEDKEWLARRAISHGAIAVISEYHIEGIPCIVVNDVWHVLKELSRLYFDDNPCKRVAIAGSIGKTTTKEMIEAVLAQSFHEFCTPNNGNVLAYLAFEIQHMPRNINQFIQEVDESYPNNAHDCSYLLRPSIAVITTIDKSHVGALGGEDKVEKAILDITAFMPEDGTVIISADDPKSKTASFTQEVISVGINDCGADCVATNIVSDDKSVDFIANYRGESVKIHLNCTGIHNVYNAMFAFVVGKLNGMKNSRICKGLKKYRPMSVRQNMMRTFGKTIYVDCFNASARSVDAALSVLTKIKTKKKGRRIAVLGDIAEIEGFETETYKQIAASIEKNNPDILITYGEDSGCLQDYFDGEGHHFNDREKLIEYLRHSLRFGDAVLFKASGSVKLDSVIKKAFPVAYRLLLLPHRIKSLKWLLKTV